MRLTNELRDKIVSKELSKKFDPLKKELNHQLALNAEEYVARESSILMTNVLNLLNKPTSKKLKNNYTKEEVTSFIDVLTRYNVIGESSFCTIEKKLIYRSYNSKNKVCSVTLPNTYALKKSDQQHIIQIEILMDKDNNEAGPKNLEDKNFYNLLLKSDDLKTEENNFHKNLSTMLNRFTTSNALIKAIPEMEIHFVGLENKPKMELLPINLIQDIRASLVRP